MNASFPREAEVGSVPADDHITMRVGDMLAEWIETEHFFRQTVVAERDEMQIAISKARMKVLLHMRQYTDAQAPYHDSLATDQIFKARMLAVVLCGQPAERIRLLTVLMEQLDAGLWATGAP